MNRSDKTGRIKPADSVVSDRSSSVGRFGSVVGQVVLIESGRSASGKIGSVTSGLFGRAGLSLVGRAKFYPSERFPMFIHSD